MLTGGYIKLTVGLPSAPRFKCEWLRTCLRPLIFRDIQHGRPHPMGWATVRPHWSVMNLKLFESMTVGYAYDLGSLP